MNRADLVRWHVLGKALQGAAAEALKAEGRVEWEENQTRANWDIRGVATAFASISQPGLEVTDETAFNRWLWEQYPTEMVVIPQPRNPEWYKAVKAKVERDIRHGVTDGVPGVKLTAGGEFQHVTVKPDSGLSTALRGALRSAVAGDPAPLQQLLQEAGYSSALDVAPPTQAITGGSNGAAGEAHPADAGGSDASADGGGPEGH